jgi:hypothetical protein
MIVSAEKKTICYNNNECMIDWAHCIYNLFIPFEFPVNRFYPFLNVNQFGCLYLMSRYYFDAILEILKDTIAW